MVQSAGFPHTSLASPLHYSTYSATVLYNEVYVFVLLLNTVQCSGAVFVSVNIRSTHG